MRWGRAEPCPEKTTPRSGFPRCWELLPVILPRAIRAAVSEPCAEELKEDYLRDRKRWRGRYSRRYVTLCDTLKTATLVGQCLWAATTEKLRKALLAGLALVGVVPGSPHCASGCRSGSGGYYRGSPACPSATASNFLRECASGRRPRRPLTDRGVASDGSHRAEKEMPELALGIDHDWRTKTTAAA